MRRTTPCHSVVRSLLYIYSILSCPSASFGRILLSNVKDSRYIRNHACSSPPLLPCMPTSKEAILACASLCLFWRHPISVISCNSAPVHAPSAPSKPLSCPGVLQHLVPCYRSELQQASPVQPDSPDGVPTHSIQWTNCSTEPIGHFDKCIFISPFQPLT